jgi:hypothetical protein
MTSGLAGISCRPVDRADYSGLITVEPGDLVRVLNWLSRL